LNWSGYAFDPSRSLLVVNATNLPFRVKLLPAGERELSVPKELRGEYGSQMGAPYAMTRAPFFSPAGLPCSAPPWGTLAAVDMNRGTIRWQVPLGTMQGFRGSHQPVPAGSLSLGGPIVTAGGLVFIAGTFDPFIRAFDIETGKELWKAPLPASGHATPMTYRGPKGKQYLVIAAGGHSKISEEAQSDALVAYTLP
jgi:quinoprotein glucose dehydrogenase